MIKRTTVNWWRQVAVGGELSAFLIVRIPFLVNPVELLAVLGGGRRRRRRRRWRWGGAGRRKRDEWAARDPAAAGTVWSGLLAALHASERRRCGWRGEQRRHHVRLLPILAANVAPLQQHRQPSRGAHGRRRRSFEPAARPLWASRPVVKCERHAAGVRGARLLALLPARGRRVAADVITSNVRVRVQQPRGHRRRRRRWRWWRW